MTARTAPSGPDDPDVAVVGADGALGSLLARELRARAVRLRHAREKLDAECSEAASADVVVNVAGPRVRPRLRWTDYLREHVGTAEAVARSMRKGARLVHVSSAAVYGTRPGEVIDEKSAEAPATFPNPAYAWAKLAAEHAARAIGRERGLEVVVLRLPLVYGPEVKSALSSLAALARQGIAIALSPPALRQHLLHTRVLVAGLRRLVASSPKGDGPILLANPCVHTNEDINAFVRSARGQGAPRDGFGRGLLRAPVPLGLAARIASRWPGFPAREAPGAVAAFAALAVDLELDWRGAFARLGLAEDDPQVAEITLE
jgi:nucleoside-diphosphate-sugar epimerase